MYGIPEKTKIISETMHKNKLMFPTISGNQPFLLMIPRRIKTTVAISDGNAVVPMIFFSRSYLSIVVVLSE